MQPRDYCVFFVETVQKRVKNERFIVDIDDFFNESWVLYVF
ncbi:hypothetical protein THERMOT_57 [Bathymodiolus thermophilus thioautotrophic gill symbiont]|nr:hypothetical protein THERMOT_57 [Bathymodiolus thermophilus thioautotrophic gill symbiont]